MVRLQQNNVKGSYIYIIKKKKQRNQVLEIIFQKKWRRTGQVRPLLTMEGLKWKYKEPQIKNVAFVSNLYNPILQNKIFTFQVFFIWRGINQCLSPTQKRRRNERIVYIAIISKYMKTSTKKGVVLKKV